MPKRLCEIVCFAGLVYSSRTFSLGCHMGRRNHKEFASLWCPSNKLLVSCDARAVQSVSDPREHMHCAYARQEQSGKRRIPSFAHNYGNWFSH